MTNPFRSRFSRLSRFTHIFLLSAVLLLSCFPHFRMISLHPVLDIEYNPVPVSSYDPLNFRGDADTFYSDWDTRLVSDTSSDVNQIKLPLIFDGRYDFSIDWGDGTHDAISYWNQPEVLHTYLTPGIYTLSITGDLSGWQFNNKGDVLKLLEIMQWGSFQLGFCDAQFYGCKNMQITATDSLDLSETYSLAHSFHQCENIGVQGDLSSWNVSAITNMDYMFAGAVTFNLPLGAWDVSAVTSMDFLFAGASTFNQPLAEWDVSAVASMDSLFAGAAAFNQPLGDWDVSAVTSMDCLFAGASAFNQPLGDWDISHVTTMASFLADAPSFNHPLGVWNVSSVVNMSSLFAGASSFNQWISLWDVSHVTTMNSMFAGASSFNSPLNSWEVSKVVDMAYMFSDAVSFNQPLNGWDVSAVTDMAFMFAKASKFNQPLNAWNVSQVGRLESMFSSAKKFNQPLDAWNVASVTTMDALFSGAQAFNHPLASWDVSSVLHMEYMFAGASAFNQPLASWNVSRVQSLKSMFSGANAYNYSVATWNVSQVGNMENFLKGVSLSPAEYDALLLHWAQLSLQSNVTFHAGNSAYTHNASAARASIIDTFHWTIIDDGPYKPPVSPDPPLIPLYLKIILGVCGGLGSLIYFYKWNSRRQTVQIRRAMAKARDFVRYGRFFDAISIMRTTQQKFQPYLTGTLLQDFKQCKLEVQLRYEQDQRAIIERTLLAFQTKVREIHLSEVGEKMGRYVDDIMLQQTVTSMIEAGTLVAEYSPETQRIIFHSGTETTKMDPNSEMERYLTQLDEDFASWKNPANLQDKK